MSKFYKSLLGISLLMVGLIISSCGGENDKSTPRLEGAQNRRTAVPTTTRETDGNASGTTGEPTGTLFILSQEILYRLDLAEESPEVIARDVSEDIVIVSPSADYIFYVVREDGAAILYKADTATGQTERLIELGRLRFRTQLQWQVGNWSPDEKWAVLRSFDFNLNPTLISVDGTADSIILSENFVNILWLEDGRLVAYEQNFQDFQGNNNPGGFAPLVSVAIIDPATGERLEPEWINELADIESFDAFLSVLNENGLNVTFSTIEEIPSLQNDTRIDRDDGGFFSGDGQFCFEESISQAGENDQREIIYEHDDVFTLMNLNELVDGSLIFIQIQYPNCTIGPPIGELIHLEPGREQEILTDQLTSQLDQNGFSDRFFDVNHRVAIAPDMEHVAWIETAQQGNQSTLVIWNVAADEISPVSFDIPEFRPRRVFWFE